MYRSIRTTLRFVVSVSAVSSWLLLWGTLNDSLAQQVNFHFRGTVLHVDVPSDIEPGTEIEGTVSFDARSVSTSRTTTPDPGTTVTIYTWDNPLAGFPPGFAVRVGSKTATQAGTWFQVYVNDRSTEPSLGDPFPYDQIIVESPGVPPHAGRISRTLGTVSLGLRSFWIGRLCQIQVCPPHRRSWSMQ